MNRRSLFKLAGGAVGAALFIPSIRMEMGVPRAIKPAPITAMSAAQYIALAAQLAALAEASPLRDLVDRSYEREILEAAGQQIELDPAQYIYPVQFSRRDAEDQALYVLRQWQARSFEIELAWAELGSIHPKALTVDV